MSAHRTSGYTKLEYVWLAADQSLRSKSRTIYNLSNGSLPPHWNYDGSSTGQALCNDSEITLVPCRVFNDPFRGPPHKLVWCKGVKSDGTAAEGYNRDRAEEIFTTRGNEEMWFGMEQEYVFMKDGSVLGWVSDHYPRPQGPYYYSVGNDNIVGREIVEDHYTLCLEAGIRISGVNAEVMLGQWEYQVGPCEELTAGDELWMARYIMERICEKYGVSVCLHPKPVPGNWNGSGCHTNFSTRTMRDRGNKAYVDGVITRLRENHDDHMRVYGVDNDQRMTGEHETSSITRFTSGAGDRGASIRIPTDFVRNGYVSGYLEDRRPASNMDPYLVTAKIAETIIPVDQRR
jgi:glutamine synthetase